jgi:putative Holliday junction resolvase
MNFLGIDYGEKRIGLAKGEDELKIATPLTTILNNEKVFETVGEIVVREQINEIIVGVPVSFDGKEHAQAQRAREFGEKLKTLNVPIHFQNEMLTSKQSEREGALDVDASSAALSLESYLCARS